MEDAIPGIRLWLVSGEEGPGDFAALADFDGETRVDSDDNVVLVGAGRAGPDPDNFILAPKEEVDESGDGSTGRYAWWVGDEGVKLRFNRTQGSEALGNPDDFDSNTPVENEINFLLPTQFGFAALDPDEDGNADEFAFYNRYRGSDADAVTIEDLARWSIGDRPHSCG